VAAGTGILEGLTPELNTLRTGNTVFVFALAGQARLIDLRDRIALR
jgi:hypothetical protein